MNHPNRKWRSLWTIDLVQQEARHHLTGLVVGFPKRNATKNGSIINLAEIISATQHTLPEHKQARYFARLLMEANWIYAETLNQGTNEENT